MPSHAATAHVGLANWGATLNKTAENWTKFTRGKSQVAKFPSARRLCCVCARRGPGSGPASQAQRAPRVISDCDVRPLLDDKPCWKMPIESFPIEEPVSALNGSPNSIEALRAPEIKLILRAFSVDPVLILDAKTKMDLVELARHHGITCVPDEWTLQKLKSKECGVEEALSQQQHYDGFEHPKSAGFTQPAPVEEEEEEDEESLVVSTGRGGAQAKKKKKTTKKKARSPRSPKSASQAEGAKKALRSAERKTAQQGLEASPESFHSTEEISLGGGSSGGGSSGGISSGGGGGNGSGGGGRTIDGGTKRTDGGGTKRTDGGTKRTTKAASDAKEKEYLILAAAPTSTAASLSAALAPAVVAAAAPVVMAAAAAHLGSVLAAAPTSTTASLSASLAPAVVAAAAPEVMAAAAAHVGSKYGGGSVGDGGSLAASGGIDLWLCQMDDINYEEREYEPSFDNLPHVVRRGQHLKSNRDSIAKTMREYGLSLDDLKAVLNQAAKASQDDAQVAEALASDERNVVVSAMNTLGLSVDEIRKVLVEVRR